MTKTLRSLAVVTVAAFLLGAVTGPMIAGTALAPITLQPGQAITITAADLPTPVVTPTPTPVPTPTPTLKPTPTPTPVPTPTATPTPTPSDPWSVPFLTRPAHGKLVISGQSNVTVSGYSFSGIADDALVIENSSNVTITGNDFSGDVGAIYCINSINVTVTWNRFRSIGDGTIGGGHSNYIQFNKCRGGYIAHNKGKGGNTEDMISIYQSGGVDATNPLIVENNAFESPLPPDPNAWKGGSGSGTMVGDAGGSHIIVRNNTYLNVGQVGIGVPGGTDIHILNNVLYGAQRTSSNVGVYVWNQSSSACSGIEVNGNQVSWKRADGVANPYWNAGNCGTVTGTNNWNALLDPAALAVQL